MGLSEIGVTGICPNRSNEVTAFAASLDAAAGLPGEFGWIIPVLDFLRMKLNL
jgi:hypothetical protein